MEANVDHSYSRHWSESYKTDHSHTKPIHWILPSCRRTGHFKTQRSLHLPASTNSNTSSDGSDDEIDVESLDEVMSPYAPGRSYDVHRARQCMNETERFTTVNLAAAKMSMFNMRSDADWEEHINKSSWSMLQTKLFSKVVKLLQDEKLARLAFKGVNNEPIARRLSLDRSAACLRRIMAEFAWDQKLTQWLHSLLTSRLPPVMLASYLDLIQTLRSKVPTLVERMIMQSTSEASSTSPDTLNILLKRPWEPTLVKYPLSSKQRLYNPPIILLIPNSPYASSPTLAHRKRFWSSNLSQLGKIVAVSSPEKTPGMTILSYLEQLASAVRSKINHFSSKNPRKSIVLAGWHTASILACHISLVEKVSAVICLGFPMQTLNGSRGTVDDVFCDITTPMMFIVGEEADSCDIDKLEDFRERLLTRCESRLIAVSGADDALRVSEKVKKKACVTQQMVDRMILDHVATFFSDVLLRGNIGTWHITEPIMDDDNISSRQRYNTEARRKRENSDELELAEIKRRRLSSSTTAKISEILGQSSTRGRDGAKTPVQGVTYNLQTGSISGLATVPTVLSRTLSKTSDSGQGSKGKGGAKNKKQSRSITIDLAKDTASQMRFGRTVGVSPDPALLATGSQTEAAVATILGDDHSVEKSCPAPPAITKFSSVPATQDSTTFLTAASSAFTRISTSSTGVSSSLPLSQRAVTSYPQSTRIDDMDPYQKSMSKPAYSNVKFSSTVIQKQSSGTDASALSTINKHHWAGILSSAPALSVKKVPELPRKYPYIQQIQDNTSHITSRSRKDERETMQATAILEQLTSGLGDDTDRSNQSVSAQGGVAGALSYRRHSYDSTFFLNNGARGRGRIRTKGASTQSPLSRELPPKRRKTVNEEKPIPPTNYYQQKMRQTQPRQDSFVRYVMTPDMSSAFSNAAAKAAAASRKGYQRQSTASDSAKLTRAISNPTILPAYTFTQPVSTTSIKVHNLTTPVAASRPGNVATKVLSGTPQSTRTTTVKKTSKVILGQRLPVKFPGAIPGSSYTFVTIPALTGPSPPPQGQKRFVAQKAKRDNVVKYSVLPRSSATVVASSPYPIRQLQTASVAPSTSGVTLSLKGNIVTKMPEKIPFATPSTKTNAKQGATIPVLASPAVVLHKLWTETASESESQAGKNSNLKK